MKTENTTVLSNKKNGFTLIELLIVITLLGIMAGLILTTYFGTIKKAHDARRRQDMENIKQGLELYYADIEVYPEEADVVWGNPLTDSTGDRIYMKVIPQDPNEEGYNYVYQTDASRSFFRLYSCLENDQDVNYTVSMTPEDGPVPNCGTGCNNVCNYGVSSTNTQP